EILALMDIGFDVPYNAYRIDNLGRALHDKFVAIAGDIADVDARKVDRAGDTMTGPLILSGDPTQQPEAATKNYVDLREIALNADLRNEIIAAAAAVTAAFQAADAIIDQRKINRDGDTMTGPLIASRDPVLPLEVATRQWIEQTLVTGGAALILVSPSAPAAPENSLWWNSTDGSLSINYNDGDSLQWVSIVGPSGPQGSAVTVRPTPPPGPRPNDLWWDSAGGQMYVWFNDGTQFQWVATISGWLP
ncbi:MAG: hypothetical protein C5B54_00045, partial [Acidobacteria bacterium]